MGLGPSEIFLVVVAILVLFGGKRLPEMARNLGRGFAEVRRYTLEMRRELNADITDSPRQASIRRAQEPNNETDSDKPKSQVNVNPASQPRTSPPSSERDS